MKEKIFIGLIILTIILWFLTIISITRTRFKNQNSNTVWLIAVLFFPVFGSILYFIMKRKFVLKEPRKFQPKFHRTKL